MNTELKFPSTRQFNTEFDQVVGLLWYPYVGKRFGSNGRRIMVFGHNAYVKKADYDKLRQKWVVNKFEWSDCIDEYTYESGWWTKTFRAFIKGAVGLKENFNSQSSPEILQRIDSFVEQIAWINFIQDAVKSDKPLALAETEQIQRSIEINREILKILGVTHCICWGKPTYEYVKSIPEFRMLSEKSEGRAGFASCVIEANDGRQIHCLKTYHPSMPGFSPFSEVTHQIFSTFFSQSKRG